MKFLLLFSALFLLFSPPQVSAQAGVKGVTISPATKQLSITADQPQVHFSLAVTNHTSQAMALTASTKDFGGLEQSGGLFFLGAEPDRQWDTHRLTPWLQITPASFSLAAGQTQVIEVTVKNDNNLTPGGHYAAVVITLSSQSSSNVAINQSLTSLLFVNKLGGETAGLRVEQVKPDRAWWGEVKGVQVGFDNTGNTHVVPRGQVIVTDPAGRTIAKGVLNPASQIMMPLNKQSFEAILEQRHLPWWPGTYTLVLSYRFDGQAKPIQKSTQVWSVGLAPIAGLALLLLAGAGWKIRQMG